MRMTVVQIGIMRMLVRKSLVRMQVRVRLARRILGTMAMLVMRVVHVPM